MSSTPNTPGTSSNSSPAPNQPPLHPSHLSNPFSPYNSAHNSTPASASTSSSSRPRIATPRSTKHPRPRNVPPPFTARMQDAQARNKDPYEDSGGDSDEGAWRGGRFDGYGDDSFEAKEKRRMAAVILDSPELLMMHSQARCDSIPATRYYFTKLLCGFGDGNDPYSDNGQMQDKEKDKSREKERERARRNVSGQSSRR
ncbi:hypothetical protein VTL71DRAFT_10904 [Oculimacula yallundae]|uniref:Uncharacterized protein n=1 Tax=Oculimacula yallundae TaxID=86028 RepID=A0ABR4CUB5_9HELO